MQNLDAKLHDLCVRLDYLVDTREITQRGLIERVTPWQERILSEMVYGLQVSKCNDGAFDQLIESAVAICEAGIAADGTITDQTAQKAENVILPISEEAKKIKVINAAHAHIDMNWEWGFDETVALTIDTFRTMLNLMEEYPEFKFSQSQASVYRIIEEYAPEMLPEIRKRVHEGRWEVAASTWTEHDKNMPNSESFARHLLYTKNYLNALLGVDKESLNFDFEPDTFGHAATTPEILANGGVKYYYHCRGYEGENLFLWEAPSGAQLLVYRELTWYQGYVRAINYSVVPAFCKKHGTDTYLKIYGVGDHGGGATRRDIEKIMEINSWPVAPTMVFGTYAEFFAEMEKIRETLPVVKDELNFIFTGCYTTQSDIKKYNRMGEAALNEAETFDALASLCTASRYSAEMFANAWENILFNQFHDILPGSNTKDSRDYAIGIYQKTMSITNARRRIALERLASRIDTSGLVPKGEDIRKTGSEGAGGGYGISSFRGMQVERGRGNTRVIHLFNTADHDREEVQEILIWDWFNDNKHIKVVDAYGKTVPHQVLDNGFNHYWGHNFMRLLVRCEVPAYGFKTIVFSKQDNIEFPLPRAHDIRCERMHSFVLENEHIKVDFDKMNGTILSVLDKESGKYLINQPTGIFRYIVEDARQGANAWVVGRYIDVKNITENVYVRQADGQILNIKHGIMQQRGIPMNGPLMSGIFIEANVGQKSKISCTITLPAGSRHLHYNLEADWLEVGGLEQGIPQLNFYAPTGYKTDEYKYDIPMGIIARPPQDRDVPGNSFALAVNPEGQSVMLNTRTKYGFRGNNDSVALTILRSAPRPDLYPEVGLHHFEFTLGWVDHNCNQALINTAYDLNHPFSFVSDYAHTGDISPTGMGFMKVEDTNVVVSALKMPEDGNGKQLIIRGYETQGEDCQSKISFAMSPRNAYFTDISENKISNEGIKLAGNDITFPVGANKLFTLCVEF